MTQEWLQRRKRGTDAAESDHDIMMAASIVQSLREDQRENENACLSSDDVYLATTPFQYTLYSISWEFGINVNSLGSHWK